MINTNRPHGIFDGFLNCVREHPERPAIEVDDVVISYSETSKKVFTIAQAITNEKSEKHFIGLLAYRSVAAYTGILGILASGKGYVPLNPNFPVKRLRNIIELSMCEILIVGQECYSLVKELLGSYFERMTIILMKRPQDYIFENSKLHHYILIESTIMEEPINIPIVKKESTAYLLFTSGSTGVPKGVAISHSNLSAFVEYICDNHTINEFDRISQTSDLNFDLSILDIFPCWERGACLVCIPKRTVMAPAKFIKEKKLTIWVSVPSVGLFLSKMRLLKPNSFPNLRYCMFCGEPLIANIAEQWQQAAPKSKVINFYGPTEATVAITEYIWDSKSSMERSKRGIVPIGNIFNDQNCCIINNDLQEVEEGNPGELCLSGTQVANGYYNNEEKTRSQFINIPSFGDTIWYRTGDLVTRDNDGCLFYIERIDSQVKILGYRVELQEIEAVLGKAANADLAVAVPIRDADNAVETVVGIVSNSKINNKNEILEFCSKQLPFYMVPKNVFFLNDIPLNSNGKIDRKELEERLKRGML